MSARRDFPTAELQEENDRIVQIYLAQNKLSLHDIVEKNASNDFKAFLAEKDEWEEL